MPSLSCPQCNTNLTIDGQIVGQKLTCGNCQHLFTIRNTAATTVPDQKTLVKQPTAVQAKAPAVSTTLSNKQESWLNQRYELKTRLGQGSFGVVWKAFDHRLKRDVAIKILHPHLVVSPSEVKQFENEAGILTQLTHPHIVPLLDRGRHGNQRFFVSSFIQGVSLQSLVPAGGMQPKRAVRLIIQILQAIRYAYGKKVLHRDIKAENAMVGENDQLWLLDFGISTVFVQEQDASKTSKERVGTPAYMAPEAIRGKHTHSSDVYSAGVVLYRLLTGRLPFEDPTMAVLTRIQQEQPPAPRQYRPDLDTELEVICLQAMAKQTEERYATAAAFEQALVHWLENQGTTQMNQATGPVDSYQPAALLPKAWIWASGLLVLVVMSIGLTCWLVRPTATLKSKPTATQNKPFFRQ